MSYLNYPFIPKIPFAPGHEIVGSVSETGPKVSSVSVGDRIASLFVHGGYSEYIYLKQDDLIKIPDSLDAGEAAEANRLLESVEVTGKLLLISV